MPISPAELAVIRALLETDPEEALEKISLALGRQKRVEYDGKPGFLIPYGRVSHEDSAKSGLGIEAQRFQIDMWIEHMLKGERFAGYRRCPVGWIGHKNVGKETDDGFFIDQAVSAYKREFRYRPAGSRVERILGPGDVVVFAKMDRGFRSLRDLTNTLHRWQDMHVDACFLDLGMDTRNAAGKLVIHVLGAVAEFDSNLKSERSRETAARLRSRGRRNGAVSAGTQIKQEGRHDGKFLELNHYELLEMQWIAELREAGRSFAVIAEMLEEKRARLEDRQRWPVAPYHGYRNRAWDLQRCKDFHRFYVAGGKPYPPPDLSQLTEIEKMPPPEVDGPIKQAVSGFSPWKPEEKESPLTRLATWRKNLPKEKTA